MPAPVLSLLKYVFLAFLYLFFLRVLRAVWIELREPKTIEVAGPTSSSDEPAPEVSPEYSTAAAAAVTTMSPAQPQAAAKYAPPVGAAPNGRLIVRAPPGMAGSTFRLTDELTVGRSPGCEVSLPGDTYVSSVHARVFRRGDSYYVEDLGSTNGTFVFSERIGGPVRLRPGDQFQVGQTILELGQ